MSETEWIKSLQGKDGTSIDKVAINQNNELVVTLRDAEGLTTDVNY